MASVEEIIGKLRGRFGRKVDLPLQVAEYHRIPPNVMFDLADYCGAIDPAPKDATEFQRGRREGRRDVWLRIQAHRNLTYPEVYALLKGEFIVKQS